MDKQSHAQKVWYEITYPLLNFNPKLQRLHRWSLGMDKQSFLIKHTGHEDCYHLEDVSRLPIWGFRDFIEYVSTPTEGFDWHWLTREKSNYWLRSTLANNRHSDTVDSHDGPRDQVIPWNLWYKSHQIPTLKWFSLGLVVFAQPIEDGY